MSILLDQQINVGWLVIGVWLNEFQVEVGVVLNRCCFASAPKAVKSGAGSPLGGEVTIELYLVGPVLALVLTQFVARIAARTLRPLQIVVVICAAAIT